VILQRIHKIDDIHIVKNGVSNTKRNILTKKNKIQREIDNENKGYKENIF